MSKTVTVPGGGGETNNAAKAVGSLSVSVWLPGNTGCFARRAIQAQRPLCRSKHPQWIPRGLGQKADETHRWRHKEPPATAPARRVYAATDEFHQLFVPTREG